MSYDHSTDIFVPALVKDGRVLIEPVWMDSVVAHKMKTGDGSIVNAAPWSVNPRDDRFAIGPYGRGEQTLTLAELQEFNPPTLAEIRNAYYNTIEPGESGPILTVERDVTGTYSISRIDQSISPYKKSILSCPKAVGEVTSTVLVNGEKIIEQPIYCFIEKTGKYEITGGREKKLGFQLPEHGWVLTFDDETGLPLKTSPYRKDAEELFGDDAALFATGNRTDGTHVVVRKYLELHGTSPFCILASDYSPDNRDWFVGVRPTKRGQFSLSRNTPNHYKTIGSHGNQKAGIYSAV